MEKEIIYKGNWKLKDSKAQLSITQRDMNLMTKTKLWNLFLKKFEDSPHYLRARLEGVNVAIKKLHTKKQLIGYIKTSNDGLRSLPKDVD